MLKRAIGWIEVASMFAVIALVAFFHRLEGPPPPEETATASSSSSVAAYSFTPIDEIEAAWEEGWGTADTDLASPTPWDPKFTVRVATAFYHDPPARSDRMTKKEAREAGYDTRLQKWVREKYKNLPAGEIGQWAVDASRPWEVFARSPEQRGKWLPGTERELTVKGAASHPPGGTFPDPEEMVGVGYHGTDRVTVRPLVPAGGLTWVYVAPFLYLYADGAYSVYDLRVPVMINRVHAQMVE